MKTDNLFELRKQIQNESELRDEITESDAYKVLCEEIDALIDKRLEMLRDIPDSRDALEAEKELIMQYMRENALDHIGDITAKMRKKKEVDTRRVMECLGGDLDNFFLLAKVQQNNLKDFCKDNPEYKGMVNDCVVEVGEEIVDIIIPI